jgi:predicted CoA-binding protein
MDSCCIAEILRNTRTIAVVGLSSRRMRPSFGVSQYLQRAGYRIIPVNPFETEVLGEKAYPDLVSVPVPVDLVNIFRRSEYVPEIVEAAIGIGAKAVWMQEGVIHEAAAAHARAAGLAVVTDRCMLKEHRRLGMLRAG